MNAPHDFQQVLDEAGREDAEDVLTDPPTAAGARPAEIAAALERLRPIGSILLVWIDPMLKAREPGQIGAKTFEMPADRGAAAAWAAEHNDQRRNLYWTTNPTRRPMSKKASKTDMAAGIMVWADADPKVKELGDYSEARAELMEELLPVVRQSASIIVDSGNGLQVFWRLTEPFALPDGLDSYEALNERMGAAFDGPSTFSADHVMRLPGTLNYPSPAKLKKGYPSAPSRARLLLADGPSYTVAQIEELIAGRALAQRLAQYLRAHPQSRARWQGKVVGMADTSHSAMLFSMVSKLRGSGGFTFDETKAIVLSWAPGGPLRNAQDPDRDFRRCWDRCHAAGGQPDAPIAGAGGEAAPKTDSARAAAAELSEDQLALSFVAQHGAWFRWSPGMDWMRNETTHWVRDDARRRFSVARKICRQAGMSVSGSDKKLARALSAAKTVAGVLTMAQADERIVLESSAWDADPFLLNTPGGVVDLRTGRMMARNDGHYFTQLAAVSPADLAAPTWDRFLREVFLADLEMIEFVQRMAGYCLTGSMREQKLFFFHGSGANGKSTLIDLLLWMQGTYAVKMSALTLMQTKNERHPNELALLRGRRMAVSSELEEGQFWAEARIKELTGDETLSARFMRQDFFEFRMTQKHVIAGNHKPRLRGGDAAMARRFVLVPFNAKFEGAARDPRMLEKLRGEGPAIMAWAVQGAVKWRDSGLLIPSSVAHASAAYMADFDDLQIWLGECCEVRAFDQALNDAASDLYASFRLWKQDRGEHSPSQTVWGERLSTVEGIQRYMSAGKVRYRGARLNLDARERIAKPGARSWSTGSAA